MSGLRIEVTNDFDEILDTIDLTDGVNSERLRRAGEVLRAKRAAELGDITLADSIDLRLEPIED